MRGLGCPVRFILTPGQAGDALQAGPLVEGLAAEVVIADTAYDGDGFRAVIADKQAVAVIPNNPRARQNTRSMLTSTPSVTSSNAALASSSSSAELPLGSRKLPEITSPS